MPQNSPVVTLPDGSQRNFDSPLTVMDVASDIGPGLAKATLAGRVNGELVDASYVISDDAEVAIVTSKNEEALELMRHDAAHVMAQAVQELYPGTQVTIGPAIEDGFYYDFAREEAFTPEDLKKIEQRMHEIVIPRTAKLQNSFRQHGMDVLHARIACLLENGTCFRRIKMSRFAINGQAHPAESLT